MSLSSCSRIYPQDRIDLYTVPSTLVLRHQNTEYNISRCDRQGQVRCSLFYVDRYPGPYVSVFGAVGDAPTFPGITERGQMAIGSLLLATTLSTPPVPFTTTDIWWTSVDFYVAFTLLCTCSLGVFFFSRDERSSAGLSNDFAYRDSNLRASETKSAER